MIDIHSHVLPGLDDGAQGMEEAVAMLRLAGRHAKRDVRLLRKADAFARRIPAFDAVLNLSRWERQGSIV